MKNFLCFSIGLALFGGTSANAALEFSVECESHAHHAAHSGDAHLAPPDDEVRIVRTLIERAYPGLPAHLKAIATKIGFVIVHKDRKITTMFQGCSAEDDPYYQYPDKTLYHPTLSPQGTIRLAVTEKFVAEARLFEKIDGAKDPEARVGADAFILSFVLHELLHAWQYHTNPVPDGLKQPSGIVDGVMSPDLIAGARAKVQYEHDAFAAHRQTLEAAPLEALAKWFDAYAAAHPAEFAKGGPFGILGYGTPGWVADSYFRNEIPMLGKGGEFSPRQRLTYEGQVAPGEVVVALIALNAELRASGTPVASALYIDRVAPLLAQWGEFMDAKIPMNAFLTDYFHFRRAIEDRFWREIDILMARLAPEPKCGIATLVSGLVRPTK